MIHTTLNFFWAALMSDPYISIVFTNASYITVPPFWQTLSGSWGSSVNIVSMLQAGQLWQGFSLFHHCIQA